MTDDISLVADGCITSSDSEVEVGEGTNTGDYEEDFLGKGVVKITLNQVCHGAISLTDTEEFWLTPAEARDLGEQLISAADIGDSHITEIWNTKEAKRKEKELKKQRKAEEAERCSCGHTLGDHYPSDNSCHECICAEFKKEPKEEPITKCCTKCGHPNHLHDEGKVCLAEYCACKKFKGKEDK